MIYSKFFRMMPAAFLFAALILFNPSNAWGEEPGTDEGERRIEYQSLRYGPDDELLGYGMHQYDEVGRKISTGWYEPAKGNVGTTRYEYDKDGRLFRESMYDRTGSMLLGYTDYTYAGKEKRETSSFTAKGVLLSSLTYDYDESGRVSRETGYGDDGEIREIILHEYDEEGNLAKSSVYGPKGNDLVSFALYEHDRKGNRTKMTVYAPDGSIYWYIRHLWRAP
jgi:hypothetical protein